MRIRTLFLDFPFQISLFYQNDKTKNIQNISLINYSLDQPLSFDVYDDEVDDDDYNDYDDDR